MVRRIICCVLELGLCCVLCLTLYVLLSVVCYIVWCGMVLFCVLSEDNGRSSEVG